MENDTKYQQAIQYKKEGEYDLSWEIFKELLKQDAEKISAIMLYEVGEVLQKLERMAQAGMYLRSALKMSRKIESGNSFYLIAKINIHLEEEKASLFYLKKAIDIDKKYIDYALQETVFEELKEHEKFKKLTQKSTTNIIESSENTEKPTTQDKIQSEPSYQVFIDLLSQHKWQTDKPSNTFENKLQVLPNAVAEYTQNPELNFKIAYYADSSLVYLQLQNTEDVDDEQIYRFYTENNITEFLATLIDYQNKLTPNNWEDFLENIIPTCKEVSFEMPDGRQVKIS